MPEIIWLNVLVGVVLGLMAGSFLNVVIHRLPLMMERQWQAQCAELSEQPAPDTAPFNLAVPRSRCPHCNHLITWYENIPLLSYLVLRGKCSACHAPIALRYPLVELITAALFGWCAWRWGLSWPAAAWAFFSAVLIALTLIDWDTTLLPDDLTLPLLWGGLIASALGWTSATLSSSLWGCVAGYLSLWLVYWGFKLLTGKEGMGYGDFKLFAALGAWFGWQALIPMILLASVIGAVVGVGLKIKNSLREGGAMPFGPFLALGGLVAMLIGPGTLMSAVGLSL